MIIAFVILWRTKNIVPVYQEDQWHFETPNGFRRKPQEIGVITLAVNKGVWSNLGEVERLASGLQVLASLCSESGVGLELSVSGVGIRQLGMSIILTSLPCFSLYSCYGMENVFHK